MCVLEIGLDGRTAEKERKTEVGVDGRHHWRLERRGLSGQEALDRAARLVSNIDLWIEVRNDEDEEECVTRNPTNQYWLIELVAGGSQYA